MSLLRLSKVAKRYDDKLVVENIDLELNRGDFACIIGPNGVGKSTIIRIAAKLIDPDEGKVKLPKNFSYMPQELSLLPWKTVKNNLLLPLKLIGKTSESKVNKLLYDFDLLDYSDKYPAQLSGGMQQKLAILQAVITDPEVILLDEPFSSLDAITRRQMQKWILGLWQQKGLTILMITHDIREAIVLGKTIIVISNRPGKVVKSYNNLNKSSTDMPKLEDKLEKLLL